MIFTESRGYVIMGSLKSTLLVAWLIFFAVSCSVISKQVRNEAQPPVALETLVRQADKYAGKTVILGGYILEVENVRGQTLISVLQSPLTFQDYPKSKSQSEGRFLVLHKGSLDPEVYTKDNKLTVAGRVLGLSRDEVDTCPDPCLKLESREIYIKPVIEYDYPSTYDYYDFDDWGSAYQDRYR
jgi:outer membrane lipoprotein